jgi:hypothetical protein
MIASQFEERFFQGGAGGSSMAFVVQSCCHKVRDYICAAFSLLTNPLSDASSFPRCRCRETSYKSRLLWLL